MLKSLTYATAPADFDYSGLSSVLVEEVRSIAVQFRSGDRKTLKDIVDRGNHLRYVKSVLHRKFSRWLAAEIDWAETTARNYMRVAAWLFGKSATLADLKIEPTAAFMLASRSVPDQARQEALRRAKRETITPAIAAEIIAALCEMLGIEVKPRYDARLLRRFDKTINKYGEHWDTPTYWRLSGELLDYVRSLSMPESSGEAQVSTASRGETFEALDIVPPPPRTP